MPDYKPLPCENPAAYIISETMLSPVCRVHLEMVLSDLLESYPEKQITVRAASGGTCRIEGLQPND
jgi:hypothetical protein